jgi:hypothetical protein
MTLFVPAIERYTFAEQTWWCKLSCSWKGTGTVRRFLQAVRIEYMWLSECPFSLKNRPIFELIRFAGGGASFFDRESSDAALHTIGLVWQAMHTGPCFYHHSVTPSWFMLKTWPKRCPKWWVFCAVPKWTSLVRCLGYFQMCLAGPSRPSRWCQCALLCLAFFALRSRPHWGDIIQLLQSPSLPVFVGNE